MKTKFLGALLLPVLSVLFAFHAKADGIGELTEVWNYSLSKGNTGGNSWFISSIETPPVTRSLAVDGNKLYVLYSTAYNTTPRIEVRNAQNPTEKYGDNLSMKGVTTTGDGVVTALSHIETLGSDVYGSARVAADNAIKVYRWKNGEGDPTQVLDVENKSGSQAGDMMNVWTDPNNPSKGKLMFAFGTSPKMNLVVYNVDGDNITLDFKLDNLNYSGGNGATGVVYKPEDETYILITSSSYPVRIDKSGRKIDEITAGSELLSNQYGSDGDMFTFNGRKYFIGVSYVTSARAGGVLELIDVTDGVSSANKEITLPSGGLGGSGTSTATGYNLDLVTDVDYYISDNGKTINLFVLVPYQGAAMYSYTNPEPDPEPEVEQRDLSQRNAYAYDIRVNNNDPYNPVVSYKLNGTASAVSIQLYIDGEPVGNPVDGTTLYYNKVPVAIPVGTAGEVSFVVNVTTANTVTKATQIGGTNNYYSFNAPFGMAINNSTDANSFGQLIVLENRNADNVKSGSLHSSMDKNGVGAGLYAFDPTFLPIKNSKGTYGFTGNMAVDDNNTYGDYQRIRYSADGRLFVASGSATRYGVYEFDPENLDKQATSLFDSSHPTWGMDVWGKGNGLIMTLLSGPESSSQVLSSKDVAVTTYNLGTGKKLENGLLHKNLSGKDVGGTGTYNWVNAMTANVLLDVDAKGFYISQNENNHNNSSYPDYLHGSLAETSVVDQNIYNNFVANGGAMAYNKDYTLLARVEGNGTVALYIVEEKLEGKAPSLSERITIAPGIGNAINGLAFDYANNLYISSFSDKKVVAYQLPEKYAGSKTSVPAPVSQNYILEKSGIQVSADVKWNDDNQTQSAVLTWLDDTNATSYKVYVNDEPAVETTEKTYTIADLPMNGKATEVYVNTVENGVESEKGTFTNVYNVEYEGPEAHARYEVDENTGRQDAVITWTTPKYGTVKSYDVLLARSTDPDATRSVVETGISPEIHSYIHENIKKNTYYYTVRAHFEKEIMPNAEGAIDYAYGPYSEAVVGQALYTAPEIELLESYDGYNGLRIHWIMPYQAAQPSYFIVYRDGIRIIERCDFMEFNDQGISDGEHIYVIEAVYNVADGEPIIVASEPVSSEAIKRNIGKAQYGLEEIYNYYIVSGAEAAALGLDKNSAFITDREGSVIPNMHLAESTGGGRGGAYRNAKFKDGKWYLTQLNDYTTIDLNEKGLPVTTAAGTPVASWNSADKASGVKAGIIEISAHDDEILADGNARRIIELNKNRSQFLGVAREESGVTLVTRADETAFYGGTNILRVYHATEDATGEGDWNNVQYVDIQVDNSENVYNSSGQIGRIHYLSADGDIWGEGGGKILMAVNKRPFMYVFDVKNLGDASKREIKQTKINLPKEFYIGGDTEENISSTENVAIPIAGRKSFVWELRSNGYYYVDMDNAVEGQNPDIFQFHGDAVAHSTGGRTFLYDGEVFLIHPTGAFSRNTGHFVIDLPKRDKGQGVSEGSFEELIPIASFTQKETTSSTGASNANAMWFGLEDGIMEDGTPCVYIYQYVPGIRFAKYRFYSYNLLPPVEPELKINIKHNEDDTDITHFDATVTWERPKIQDENGHWMYFVDGDWVVDHYQIDLYDNNMQLIKTENQNSTYVSQQGIIPQYKFHFGGVGVDENGEKEYSGINENPYVASVTPFFRQDKETTSDYGKVVKGEPAYTQDINGYEASMGWITAKCYKTGKNFRVDIDCAPADKEEYPEPVSYFEIDYSKDGGETWESIPNLWLFMNGGQGYSTADDKNAKEGYIHDNSLPGTYVFEAEDSPLAPRGTLSTKALSSNGTDKKMTEEGCYVVGYYYTDNEPDQNTIYRATAVYAATNNVIRKEAPVYTEAEYSGPSTAVIDVLGDNDGSGAVKVYPVPAETTITVECGQPIDKVNVYSMNGALVKSVKGNGMNTMTVDVSAMPADNYIVIVNNLVPVHIVKK